MTKREMLELLERLGISPSKKLGQNFLIDQNIIEVIIKTVQPIAEENVLEIGPGTGVLTQKLIDNATNLTAVEFDWRLAKYIRETYSHLPNFRIIESDACDLDYDEVMGEKPYRCIANLPYAISSIFLSLLAGARNPPQQIFVMLQKEMAERMTAKPSSKSYGQLSIRMQAIYNVSIARKIPNTVFHPNPDVDSALMNAEILPRAKEMTQEFRKKLEEISKLAFSQRRKQVKKALSQKFPLEKILDFFKRNNLPETARAEEISVEQYIEFTKFTMEN